MKKIKAYLALVLIILSMTQLFGCAVNIPIPEEISSTDEADAIGLSVGKYDRTLFVGDYKWLRLNIKIDYKYALKWSSSNPDVLSVDSSGRVDALSPGKATITASVKKSSVQYDITVKEGKTKNIVSSSTANISEKNKLMVDQNKNSGKDINLYSIHVNAETNCMTVYTYNSDGYYYLPVRSMVCSVAKDISVYENEDSDETIYYQIKERDGWYTESEDEYYRYNSIFGYGDTEFKISSCAYSKESPSSLIASEYNKLGTGFTDGDIRLSADDAKWVYENCDKGTQIRIVTSGGTDELKRPEPVKIADEAKYKNWDPTDPDKNNPYLKETPTFTGVDELHIPKGSVCDVYRNVKVYDSCMNLCGGRFSVDSNVSSHIPGEYIVTYYFTDGLGHYGRADRKVIVD